MLRGQTASLMLAVSSSLRSSPPARRSCHTYGTASSYNRAMSSQSWFLKAQAGARARAREHARLLWCAAASLFFWLCMMFVFRNGWSTLAMVMFVAMGLKWSYHFYEYRCARIETHLWPW